MRLSRRAVLRDERVCACYVCCSLWVVSITLMFGVAGGRSTHGRMNSGTRTVSVNERPPAHVCRREQLSLSQTLGLHFITRGSVDVEPLPGLHIYLVCKADIFTLKILQMDQLWGILLF